MREIGKNVKNMDEIARKNVKNEGEKERKNVKNVEKSEKEEDFPYFDILDSERPASKHKKMPREQRAKQFSPFEALGELEN
ncbi:hypothetical protein IKG02_00390 [Candidatus Saccharibacteria bacterium]|nr:hypothetical protein [Candidatus Saccharibacteria bacterium]